MKRVVGGSAIALLALTSIVACDGGAPPSSAPSSSALAPVSASTPRASASSSSPAASASVDPYADNPHKVPIGIPAPAKKVLEVLNPKGEAPYAGPKGTLKGVVRVKGDPSPDSNMKISPGCTEAKVVYQKLFRVGLDRALADVMVAVTEYPGFVPPREEAKKVTVKGCAPSSRTIVVTYGQRIEIANVDKADSYMPYLDGSPTKATMVAVPGGAPVKLYPQVPGHYMLRDMLPTPIVAEVFALAYATHDVTGLDGKYEIKDIPAGNKVKVSAYLPVLDKAIEKIVDIKEGDNTFDIEIEFNEKKDMERLLKKPKGAPSASASAAPLSPPKPTK